MERTIWRGFTKISGLIGWHSHFPMTVRPRSYPTYASGAVVCCNIFGWPSSVTSNGKVVWVMETDETEERVW